MRTIGVFLLWPLISGIHFSLTFWNVLGITTLKQRRNTQASECQNHLAQEYHKVPVSEVDHRCEQLHDTCQWLWGHTHWDSHWWCRRWSNWFYQQLRLQWRHISTCCCSDFHWYFSWMENLVGLEFLVMENGESGGTVVPGKCFLKHNFIFELRTSLKVLKVEIKLR